MNKKEPPKSMQPVLSQVSKLSVKTQDGQKLSSDFDPKVLMLPPMRLKWPYQAGEYYSVLIFYGNSRELGRPIFAVMNVKKNKLRRGDIVMPFSPMGVTDELLFICVYRQTDYITDLPVEIPSEKMDISQALAAFNAAIVYKISLREKALISAEKKRQIQALKQQIRYLKQSPAAPMAPTIATPGFRAQFSPAGTQVATTSPRVWTIKRT